MHPVLLKTLGGLNRQYYFRQLFFAILIAAFVLGVAGAIDIGNIMFVVTSTLLYPYSRFVYESVVSFVVGDNIFFGNAFLVLFVKMMTMAACWSMAIFIAPIGLAYLYFRHSRAKG